MATFIFNSWLKDLAFGTILPAPGSGLTKE